MNNIKKYNDYFNGNKINESKKINFSDSECYICVSEDEKYILNEDPEFVKIDSNKTVGDLIHSNPHGLSCIFDNINDIKEKIEWIKWEKTENFKFKIFKIKLSAKILNEVKI